MYTRCFRSTLLLTVMLSMLLAGCATLPAGTSGNACLSADLLTRKKAQRLKEIAADVRLQRQAMADFEGHLTRMGANLAAYNRYIQAGSLAASFAKMLPIPYAGQAGVFAKFVSQSTVALNTTSLAISKFQASSQKFLALADAIEPGSSDRQALDEASRLANRELLPDMLELQQRLAAVADLSAGALSFLESLNQYVGSTDDYLNKAKGLFKKDTDPKEKSFLSESTGSLRNQAATFNQRFTSYSSLTVRQTTQVKSLSLFDELAAAIPR